MIVYISLIIWCAFTGYLSQHTKCSKATRKLLTLLPIIAIFIVSAIRYNVGTDYSGTYMGTYYKILSGQDATMTLIPTMIYKIIIKLGLDAQWFFVITSFLICYFLYKSIEDQSNSRWLSYYIFICGCFLFFSYNGIRQAVGMTMFYYSIRYLENGIESGQAISIQIKRRRVKGFLSISKSKWVRKNVNAIKYFLMNIISTGFHITGAVFLPMYFTLKMKLKTKTKVIITISCIVFSSAILPYVFGLINSTRYAYYIDNSDLFSQGSLNVSMYINILLLLCYEYIYYKNKDVSDRDIIYGNIHFYGLIITLFVTRIPLAYRLFYSFRYIEFLSIPNLLGHCKKKYRLIITICVVGIFFAYFILMIGRNNSHSVLPYLTIFDR